MATAIQLFEYEGQTIEFDFSNDNVMVNATEMAKIYGKDVKDFNKLESTVSFINICINGDFSSPLGITKKEDLIISKPRTGTWMHRVLALKFASWLDPNFELWVYTTIDKMLFGTIREDARQKAKIDKQHEELHNKLLLNPDYADLMSLENSQKFIKKKLNQQFKNQVLLFG